MGVSRRGGRALLFYFRNPFACAPSRYSFLYHHHQKGRTTMGFMFQEGDRVLAAGKIGTVTRMVVAPPDANGHCRISYNVTADSGAEMHLPGKQLIRVTDESTEPETVPFIVEVTVDVAPQYANTDAIIETMKAVFKECRPTRFEVRAMAAWPMFEAPPEDSNAGQWGAQNLDDNPEPF